MALIILQIQFPQFLTWALGDAATASTITVNMKAASWMDSITLAVGFSATAALPETFETVEVTLPAGATKLEDGAEVNDALFETLATDGTALTLELSWDKFPVEEGKFRYIILQNTKTNNWGWGPVLLTNVKAAADNSKEKKKNMFGQKELSKPVRLILLKQLQQSLKTRIVQSMQNLVIQTRGQTAM